MLKAKKLSLTAVLALLGATLVAPPAWAATVNCSSGGTFTITDNVVTGSTNCAGTATIPSTVTSIGDAAFAPDTMAGEVSVLNSIIIPSSVASIGFAAFQSASVLDTVTFTAGSTLVSIGNQAFYGATSLSSIAIPSSVTSIGRYAFSGTSLASITFYGNAPSVGDNVFSSVGNDPVANIGFAATGFGEATTWNGLTIVRADASVAVNCSSGGTFTITDNVVTGSTNCAGEAVIPNSVTSIGDSAFNGASGLTSINIPNSVTSIGEYAFNGTALTSITIPSSITSIGEMAFNRTTALKTVTFASGSALASIGTSAFNGASSLTSINIPNSVTSIGSSAFSGTNSLTSISIPSSVTSIGSYAFNNASELKSITFAGNAPSVGSRAFNNVGADLVVNVNFAATGFGTATTWNGLTIVSARTVSCSTSGSFTITDNVVTGNTNCAGEAVIPNSVTSIAVDAFKNATSLTSVTFETGSELESIGISAFFGANKLGSIAIPNSVTSIGGSAFGSTTSLTSVTFETGSELKSIPASAFSYATKLGSITIPNSVTSIGQEAFKNCTSLTSVTFEGDAPTTVGTDAFSSVGNDPVANIGFAATGFGEATTWNGLTIVRAADLTPPTATPVTGDTNAGATLVINGTNMDRITEVKIGGTVVPITARTTTSITVTVPAGLAVGNYTITLTTDDAAVLAGGFAQVVAGEVKAATNQKVNAGSFNTYVAVYAKGYKGQRLSWKIAGKWFKTILTKDYQVFQRKTIAVGLEVKVDLFIDGKRLLAKTVLTR